MIEEVSFELTVTNSFEPGSVQKVNGGFQIRVDETCLNRHKGRAESGTVRDSETVGEWLYEAVADVCARFLSGVDESPIPQDEPLLVGFVETYEDFEEEVRDGSNAREA